MQDSDRQRACLIALGVAREAGAVLLSFIDALERDQVRTKSSARDIVTEADVAAERLMVERLRAALPEHAIEAEEEVRDAPDEGRLRWFLDPLDGTVNYFHRLPLFCVSMGLWSGAGPEVAVVHAPLLGETFHAIRGGGAWVEGLRGRRPLAVSGCAALGEAVLATGFPYRREELEHSNLENFGRLFYDVRGMRRMGSAALDLAFVAAGRLDGFWELHLSPHDVAAGGLLVREAGGIVTDADGGQDWLRGGSLVASAPDIHASIQERVKH